MQHTQFNFSNRKLRLAAILLFLAGQPVLAGPITQPAKPDPLLDGGPTVPCAAGADYAPGTDANGASVAPADIAAGPVLVPDAIAIPLSQGRSRSRPNPGPGGAPNSAPIGPPNSAYVAMDGHKLAPLLNPPPCTTPAQ